MVTKYPQYSKNVRMRPETLKLINKLDKSRSKTPNQKIFELLQEFEKMKFRMEGLEK